MIKILIMGLPGAGKTTLAKEIVPVLKAEWLNADKIRTESNDWDFSLEGRKRQAKRMADLAESYKNKGKIVVADFICPTPESRELFGPDFVIWMDTIQKGRFDDTNKMFIKPKKYDLRITEKNSKKWAEKIFQMLKKYNV